MSHRPETPPPAYSSLSPLKPVSPLAGRAESTVGIARSLASGILAQSDDIAARTRFALPLLLVSRAWQTAVESVLWAERQIRTPAELMAIVEVASARPDVLVNLRRLSVDLDAQAAPVIALLLSMCPRVIELEVRLSGSGESVGALLDAVLTMDELRRLDLAVETAIPASFVVELLEACSALRQLSVSAIDEDSAAAIGRTALYSLSIRGSVGLGVLEHILSASPDLRHLDLDEVPLVARLVLRVLKERTAMGRLATLRLASAAEGARTVEMRLLGAMCRLREIALSTI